MPEENPFVAEAELDKEQANELIIALKQAVEDLKIVLEKITAFFKEHSELKTEKGMRDFLNSNNDSHKIIAQELINYIWEFINICKRFMGETEENNLVQSIFHHLGIAPELFAHNLGHIAITSFLSPFRYGFLIKPRTMPKTKIHKLSIRAHGIEALIKETMSHLQCITSDIERALGTHEESQSCSNVVDAIITTVRSRLLFELFGIDKEIKGLPTVFTPQFGEDICVPIPEAELINLIYFLTSNATKRMEKLKEGRKAKASDLILEEKIYEIEYQGERFTIIEIFNSGASININQLHKNLTEAELNPAKLNQLSERTQQIIQTAQQGSRQVDLSLINPEEIIFLEGFSQDGSTGLGLNTARRLIITRQGGIAINNVYGETPRQTGFCVTLIIPSEGNNSIDTTRERAILEIVKELIQKMKSGTYILPKIERKAA